MSTRALLIAASIGAASVVVGCGDDVTATSGAGGDATTTSTANATGTSANSTTSATSTTSSSSGGGPMCATGTWDDDGDPQTPCIPWSHCMAGQHVDQPGSATSDQTCTACESGTFTLATDAASCDAWTTCDPGEHISMAGSATSDQKCVACESGTYSSSPNQSVCTPDGSCPAGTFLTMPGTPTSPTMCTACTTIGTYCAGGTAAPTPCVPGTWDNDMSTASACVAWTDCIAGQRVVTNGSATTDRTCVACASGSLSTTTNAMSCTPWTTCTAGQHIAQMGSATTDQTCVACASSTFSATANAPTCAAWTNCVAGEHVDQPGSATADRTCLACASNTFSTTTNAASCAAWSNCVPGQHIDQDGTPTSNRTCLVCASGTFSTTANAATCTPWTQCQPGELESTPGTSTSDRVCVPAWPREFGSASVDLGWAVSVDASGNVVVAGRVGATLPGQTGLGLDDALVRKYAPDATVLWTREFGSSNYDYANGVGVDASGNIYVVGSTGGALSGQVSAGAYDAWLRKYNPAGTEIWTRQFGTTAYEAGDAMSMAPNGDIVVAGRTTGTLPGQSSAGGWDAFVRKYDANGTALWTHQFGSSGDDDLGGVSVDASGNIFVVGTTPGALPGQTHIGSFDAWLRAYAPDGTLLWTRQFGSASDDEGERVAVDPSGNVLVSGFAGNGLPAETSPGGFVRKYAPDGTELWTEQAGFARAYGVTADASGNVFVTGYTLAAIPGQTSIGGEDAFVIEYAADGTVLWSTEFGTSSSDEGYAVCMGLSGDVFVTGATDGAFPQQSNAGSSDVFVDHFVP